MNETSFKLREVTLEPKELSAYLTVTNKLLNNWQASNTFITQQLQWAAVRGAEDYDMLRGDGVNKCTGIINSSAAISYSRAGANAISFTDVVGMLSKVKMGGPLIWAASQTIIPQLASMVDSGGHAVWLGGNGNQGAAANAAPSTLLGFPLMFVDRMPGIGSKGDLCLLNLPYYLIKDGSGPIVASSEHILFLSNKTVFKVVWNVDGRPWLSEPLQLEGSVSNTVSPFVVLN
jgi:HK97 family phage major capsid protein